MPTVDASAVDVRFVGAMMYVRLAGGRDIGAPVEWFPPLRDATPEQRQDWRLVGRGVGIHWQALDEDLSVAGLLAC